jgi:lipopolysaccharide assembly protein A
MGLFRILIWLAAFGLGAAVSYYNWSVVTFHYLAGQADVPLIALLFGAFLLGVLVMWLLDFARLFTLSRDSRRQQRQIVQLEAELKSLRNLPLEQGAAAPPSTPPPATNA